VLLVFLKKTTAYLASVSEAKRRSLMAISEQRTNRIDKHHRKKQKATVTQKKSACTGASDKNWPLIKLG